MKYIFFIIFLIFIFKINVVQARIWPSNYDLVSTDSWTDRSVTSTEQLLNSINASSTSIRDQNNTTNNFAAALYSCGKDIAYFQLPRRH